MNHDRYRSYAKDIASNIEGDWEKIGQVGDYPLFYIKKGHGDHHVLITGGVHGDEPAGTFAALEFEPSTEETEYFTFHIYPCMNPWGFERTLRENAQKIDLNRGFKEKTEGIECQLFADHVKRNFLFTIDFHEGSSNFIWKDFPPELNPKGAWLYESCKNKSIRMGRQMIDAVEEYGLEVAKTPTIYDDINDGGIVSYPEGMRSADYATQDSFDAYLWKNHTIQAFTSETDMIWDLEDRILAHHLMLKKALQIKMLQN